MRARILVDTGPLVAIFSQHDQYHEICVDQLRSLAPPLLTCWPVITEAAWLLRQDPPSMRRLLKSIEDGLFALLPLEKTCLKSVASFLHKYQSCGAQLADVCLLHLAERESIETIFTLDRRDFMIYRIHGNQRLELLPDK